MNEIKFLMGFINKRLLLALCFSFFGSLSSILLLGVSAYLITSAALHPPLYTLSLAVTLVRAAGLLRAVFRYLERLISHSAVFEIEKHIKLKYYEKAFKTLPMKEGKNSESVFLNGILKGAENLRDFYIRSLLPITLTFVIAVLTTFILFSVIKYMSLIIILTWMLHILLSKFFMKNTNEKNFSEDYKNILTDISLGKNFLVLPSGIKNIISLLNKKSNVFSKTTNKIKIANLKTNYILQLIRDLCFFIIFIFLIVECQNNNINIVWLSVYALSTLSILDEFRVMPTAVLWGKKGLIYSKDLISLKNEDVCDNKTITKETAPILDVKNLCFGYNENDKIIKNITFTLNNCETIAILGESGAGKTTLASVLLNLYKKTSGNIYINGKSYDNLSDNEIRKNFSALLQNTHIFNDTIENNFKFVYDDITEEKIRNALKICGLNLDLNIKIGFDGNNLSGGERTRLLTAIAILSNAPILILDEPTLGLDKKTSEDIIKNIFGSLKKSIILITHDKNLIKYADKVIVLGK